MSDLELRSLERMWKSDPSPENSQRLKAAVERHGLHKRRKPPQWAAQILAGGRAIMQAAAGMREIGLSVGEAAASFRALNKALSQMQPALRQAAEEIRDE